MENHNIKIVIEPDEDPLPPDAEEDSIWLAAHVRGHLHTGIMNRQHILVDPDRSKKYFIYKVYGYLHSGLTLGLDRDVYPFNCRFDSGLAGEVYAEIDSFDNEHCAKQAAEHLIEQWNQYLDGDVWSVYARDEDGAEIEWVSMSGVYGRASAEECGKELLEEVLDYRREQTEKIDRVWAQ